MFARIRQRSLQRQKLQPSVTTGSSAQIQEVFNVTLGKNVVDIDNPSVAFKYILPNIPNERETHIVTESFSTSIFNYVGQQFPLAIHVCILDDGLQKFEGYKSITGTTTNRLITMNLKNISSSTQLGITSRDLTYQSQPVNIWDIGQIKNLKLAIYLDQSTTPLELPLANSINVMFRIVHVK